MAASLPKSLLQAKLERLSSPSSGEPMRWHLFSPSSDPVFLQAHVIPDSSDHSDDKLYFFFREKALEGAVGPAVLARVGRVCLVSRT